MSDLLRVVMGKLALAALSLDDFRGCFEVFKTRIEGRIFSNTKYFQENMM
jgi:hypothetical protein